MNVSVLRAPGLYLWQSLLHSAAGLTAAAEEFREGELDLDLQSAEDILTSPRPCTDASRNGGFICVLSTGCIALQTAYVTSLQVQPYWSHEHTHKKASVTGHKQTVEGT